MNSILAANSIDDRAVAVGDAIQVRFFCEVQRGGAHPIRHELRRRLVVPMMLPGGVGILRRLMTRDQQNKRLTIVREDDGSTLNENVMTTVTSQNLATRAFGTAQLLYWMLLMMLGVLLMDVYLCEMAGRQVVETVECLNPDDRDRILRMQRRGVHKAITSNKDDDGDGGSRGSDDNDDDGDGSEMLRLRRHAQRMNRVRRIEDRVIRRNSF